ncbi:MAG: sugar ABC transporter ATP-binding protein [Burkholderiaceae bacterium]|nr:sugar ABC transporter ATP-binding protein [Burkholderiaceae bacterium]
MSIEFFPGEVHALVGENGAGKSTLMRLLAGEERPDSGAILIKGKAVSLDTPVEARAHGIAIVHQNVQLVGPLTVAENMCLGAPPVRWALGPLRFVDRRRMRREARRRLADFRLDQKVDCLVKNLTVAERQLVEIARAMDDNARLLILDEPTAPLGAAEVRELFRHVAVMRANGAAIILIAHNIEEVMEVADRISVLRNGRLIASRSRTETSYNDVVRLIVGREISRGYPRAEVSPGEVMLRSTRLIKEAGTTERPLEIRRSQIVGIPTYVGAAVEELLDGLMGQGDARGADLWLQGRDISRATLHKRVALGICLVPGDAMDEGLIPGFSIEDNILLPNGSRFSRAGILRRDALRQVARSLIDELDIRPGDPATAVRHLSGGNRQKVVIAKWLASGAGVYLMNDPTKAVDVGAKSEIYRLIVNLVATGRAVLLVSSDLDELVGLADQVLVLRGTQLIREFRTRPIAKDALIDAVVGSRS